MLGIAHQTASMGSLYDAATLHVLTWTNISLLTGIQKRPLGQEWVMVHIFLNF